MVRRLKVAWGWPWVSSYLQSEFNLWLSDALLRANRASFRRLANRSLGGSPLHIMRVSDRLNVVGLGRPGKPVQAGEKSYYSSSK